ncbi:Uncharacterised protein [Vibrio cholerae]|nr:Uncharacterised protein [Vibrio cholerae]
MAGRHTELESERMSDIYRCYYYNLAPFWGLWHRSKFRLPCQNGQSEQRWRGSFAASRVDLSGGQSVS